MRKPHETPHAERYRKRDVAAICVAFTAVPVSGLLGWGISAADAATLKQKGDRVNHQVLNAETDVWAHNLESDGKRPTLFKSSWSGRDGRHFRLVFRAYSGRRGHRHLLLKLKLRAVIMPAVIEEEEFLFEDGTGWVYYDTAHSIKVWSTNR